MKFARIEIAEDGEQVLFSVFPMDGGAKLVAMSPKPNGRIFSHEIWFDDERMAFDCIEAFDAEQVEFTRKMARQHALPNLPQ